MIEDIINPSPARKLINKFYYQLPNNGYRNEGLLSCERRYNEAITCAIVCVEEILNDYEEFPYKIQLGKDHWNEVKQELIQIQNDQMEIQTGG
jgi:hypothetical protein